MGLDMNILRISKPHLATDRVYERSELHGVVLDKDDPKLPMYRELTPYLQEVQVRNQYYDMEKIRKDYGLSEESYIWHLSSASIGITERSGGKSVEIPSEIIDERYTVERVETCYVCNSDDVQYWRKAYDIQQWFYDNLESNVENTGYYILSETILKKFNKAWPDDRVFPEDPDEESALFYWEWY